jgi:hypothetical protein
MTPGRPCRTVGAGHRTPRRSPAAGTSSWPSASAPPPALARSCGPLARPPACCSAGPAGAVPGRRRPHPARPPSWPRKVGQACRRGLGQRSELRLLTVHEPEPGRGHPGPHPWPLRAAAGGRGLPLGAGVRPHRQLQDLGPGHPAVLEWTGPLVATSVKPDLLRATLAHRARLGQVLVIDPLGASGVTATLASTPASGVPSRAWVVRPRRAARFARLIQRRGRVLGGPAVRAACGGNLKPALVTTQGDTACPRPSNEAPCVV